MQLLLGGKELKDAGSRAADVPRGRQHPPISPFVQSTGFASTGGSRGNRHSRGRPAGRGRGRRPQGGRGAPQLFADRPGPAGLRTGWSRGPRGLRRMQAIVSPEAELLTPYTVSPGEAARAGPGTPASMPRTPVPAEELTLCPAEDPCTRLRTPRPAEDPTPCSRPRQAVTDDTRPGEVQARQSRALAQDSAIQGRCAPRGGGPGGLAGRKQMRTSRYRRLAWRRVRRERVIQSGSEQRRWDRHDKHAVVHLVRDLPRRSSFSPLPVPKSPKSGASDQASPTATRASAGPFARLQTASPESAGSLEFGQSAPPAPKDGQFQDTQQGFATPRFFQTDVSSSLTGDLEFPCSPAPSPVAPREEEI